jgi:predicted Fe-S protein YdhL (DUF1289 family)
MTSYQRIFFEENLVNSPCIDICKVNSGICIGCKRTLEEIKNWSNYSVVEKNDILKKIKDREIDCLDIEI